LERESLKELGRDGSKTWADCYFRKWNNGTDWCNSANARCLGCTEPGFPNKFSPFYRVEGLSQQGKGRDQDLKPGGNGRNVGGDRATTA
jgi:Ni,Fe-hydrogenase I small subunit